MKLEWPGWLPIICGVIYLVANLGVIDSQAQDQTLYLHGLVECLAVTRLEVKTPIFRPIITRTRKPRPSLTPTLMPMAKPSTRVHCWLPLVVMSDGGG